MFDAAKQLAKCMCEQPAPLKPTPPILVTCLIPREPPRIRQ